MAHYGSIFMARCFVLRILAPTIVLAAIIVAGCQSENASQSLSRPAVVSSAPPTGAAGQTSVTYTRFPDMPIPTEGRFDLDQTLVFGTEDAWFGRIVIHTQYSPDDMFEFYQMQMPAFGWGQVTAIRAATSILAYSRRERIATLQIQSTEKLGTEVLIIVSPRRSPDARTGIPAQ
jgi:hypothetical protein